MNIAFGIYVLYVCKIFSSGYGNKVLAIVMQVIFLLCWASFFIGFLTETFDDLKCIKKYVEHKKHRLRYKSYYDSLVINIRYSLIFFLGFIYTLYCFYLRLKLENINIINRISKLLENEWIKGIAIGVISGTVSAIIAGLILNKLNKNKNSNDKNANGEDINNNKKI